MASQGYLEHPELSTCEWDSYPENVYDLYDLEGNYFLTVNSLAEIDGIYRHSSYSPASVGRVTDWLGITVMERRDGKLQRV